MDFNIVILFRFLDFLSNFPPNNKLYLMSIIEWMHSFAFKLTIIMLLQQSLCYYNIITKIK